MTIIYIFGAVLNGLTNAKHPTFIAIIVCIYEWKINDYYHYSYVIKCRLFGTINQQRCNCSKDDALDSMYKEITVIFYFILFSVTVKYYNSVLCLTIVSWR